jgi:spore coat protein A
MAFRVSKPLNGTYPATRLPRLLSTAIGRLATTLPSRQLILFEGIDGYGRLQTRLGIPNAGGLMWKDDVTEQPLQGSTEIWEIYNNTVDAHPIHVHMVKMQMLNRQNFTANVNLTTGVTTNIRLVGAVKNPAPEELGWKDTYVMNPGEVTRIIATFNLPGRSAWHCHILSHEDHEMMRPYYIVPNSAVTTSSKSANDKDADIDLEKAVQFKTRPNPFSSDLVLEFTLAKATSVTINLYDSKGSRVKEVYKGKLEKGNQQFTIHGSQWSNGTYFCELVIDDHRIERKLVLQK